MTTEKDVISLGAATIFRDRILSEIGEESDNLRHENSRLQPLRDCLAEVVIHFPSKDDRSELNVIKSLKEGTDHYVDGVKRLLIPFSSPSLVLAKYFRTGRINTALSVRMANTTLGSFPSAFPATQPSVRFNEDNTMRLVAYVSRYVYVEGKLENLSRTDEEAIRDGYNGNLLNIVGIVAAIRPLKSPDATFTPEFLSMEYTSELKETLAFVNSSFESLNTENEELSPSEQLRHLALTALGEGNHLDLLRENRRLKLENDVLMKIRASYLLVKLSVPDSHCINISLEEGHFTQDLEGKETWQVNLPSPHSASIAVADIGKVEIFHSGIPLTETFRSYWQSSGRSETGFIANENRTPIGLRISYLPFLNVVGAFNTNELSEDEYRNVLPDFVEKMDRAIHGDGFGLEVEPFPPMFKLKLVYVSIDASMAKKLLGKAGVSCDERSAENASE